MGSRRNLLSRHFDLVPLMLPQPLIGAARPQICHCFFEVPLTPRPHQPSLTPPLARVSPPPLCPLCSPVSTQCVGMALAKPFGLEREIS